MSESGSSTSGGIGTFGLLGIVFVVLKLTHVIAWSWWWVTAPFWGGLALVLAIVALFFGGAGILLGFAALLDWKHTRARRKKANLIA